MFVEITSLFSFLPGPVLSVMTPALSFLDYFCSFVMVLCTPSGILSLLFSFPCVLFYCYVIYLYRDLVRQILANDLSWSDRAIRIKDAIRRVRQRGGRIRARHLRAEFAETMTPILVPNNCKRFTITEITALTGCIPGSDAWIDLHTKMLVRNPSFPIVPDESVRITTNWLRYYKYVSPVETPPR